MAKRRKVGRPKKLKGSVGISLRVHEDLLRDLKMAANESGHGNLSREINYRLRASLVAQGIHNEEMRAISYLMERVLNILPGGKLMNDRWRFTAFSAATVAILNKLAPKGKMTPPSDYGQISDVPNIKEADPVALGTTAGNIVLLVLLQGSPGAEGDYAAQVRASLGLSGPITESKAESEND